MNSLGGLYLRTFRFSSRPRTRTNSSDNREGLRGVGQVLHRLREAARLAATSCPRLQYIKIETDAESSHKWKPIIRSWTVTRVSNVDGSSMAQLQELSEDDDEVDCPRGFWSEERTLRELVPLHG